MTDVDPRFMTSYQARDHLGRMMTEVLLGLPTDALNDWQVKYDGHLVGSHTLKPVKEGDAPRTMYIVQVGHLVHSVLITFTDPPTARTLSVV